MKPRFRFAGRFPEPTTEDITYRDGKIEIQGQALARLKRRARRSGVPIKTLINLQLAKVTCLLLWSHASLTEQGIMENLDVLVKCAIRFGQAMKPKGKED